MSKYTDVLQRLSSEIKDAKQKLLDDKDRIRAKCDEALFHYIMNKPGIDEHIISMFKWDKMYNERVIFTKDEFAKLVVYDDEKNLLDVTDWHFWRFNFKLFAPFVLSGIHGNIYDDLSISPIDCSRENYDKVMAEDDSGKTPEQLRLKKIYEVVYKILEENSKRKLEIQNKLADKIVELILQHSSEIKADLIEKDKSFVLNWKDIDAIRVIHEEQVYRVTDDSSETNGYFKISALLPIIRKKLEPLVCISYCKKEEKCAWLFEIGM